MARIMFSARAVDTLKSLAPTVMSALAGPLAGTALTAIGDVFGITTPTQAKIAEKIEQGTLTPDQLSQAKAIELEYQKHETELGFQYADLEFKDREGARTMQVATQSSVPAVLTYLVTLGFFGVLGYMISSDYKASEPLLVMLGSLGTAWVAVVTFWFGSSHGSMQKTNLLAQAESLK